MSPEQGRDFHEVDIRSDLYSLGCTFYYGLTGQVPFPGDTAMEKLIKHLTEEPRPIRELRPEIPVPLAEIIHKLLAKSPEDRFQTPAELLAALEPLGIPGPRSYSSLDTLTGPPRATPSNPELGSGWLLVPNSAATLSNPDLGASAVPLSQTPANPVATQATGSPSPSDPPSSSDSSATSSGFAVIRRFGWLERLFFLYLGLLLGFLGSCIFFLLWRR
jgi:serine/threonine protein kinase